MGPDKGGVRAGATTTNAGSTAAQVSHSTEVLGQGGKLPQSPFKMALGGFAAIAALGYIVLYAKKKHEASAMDVAKVTVGDAKPKK